METESTIFQYDNISQLTITCQRGYVLPNGTKSIVRCHNGSWSRIPFHCVLSGEAITEIPTLLFTSVVYESIHEED